MSFLSPWFLAGLVALALPLWLHRLEQRSAEKRVWSSLVFFRHAVEASVRRRRFRYLALMACRLMLVALLALLFARPVADAGLPLAGPPAPRHVIALDTSLSMGFADTWTRAQQAVASVLGRLGPGARSQAVAFGPGVDFLGGPTANHGAWRSALSALAASAGRASYGELGEAVRALARDEPGALHVHVISDFQRSGAPERFADFSLPPGATLVPHDVGSPSPRPNWCIEGVSGRLRLHGPQRGELLVTVAGFETPETTRRVELHVGGKRIDAAEVRVPASGRAAVRFADVDVARGHARAEVRLVPGDALPADDVSYLLLERTDSLPVLFIRAPADARAELYYRTALEAAGTGTFEVQTVTPTVAQGLALTRFAFVVVHDVPTPPALLESRLRTFVEQGQAMFVVLGAAAARERRAAWIGDPLSDSGRAARSLHGAPVPSAHPALSAGGGLQDVRVHRHLRVPAPAERVLVRLGDGSPLLFEQPLGRGRLLVLTSPLDTEWNDWPLHVSFVPFAASSARWLAGLEDLRRPSRVGESLDLGAADAAASVQVIDPDGRRVLGLAESVSARTVRLLRAGFYEVRRPGRTEPLAVNPDPRESDLRRLDAETIARWQATGGPSEAAVPGAAPPPRDISGYVLWALLAMVLVESTLANRYLKG